MKTRILLIGFLAAIALSLNARSTERRLHLALGFEPHVNWMQAGEAQLPNAPVRMALSGGIRVDYLFLKPFAFSFGANWNQTGGNIIYKRTFVLDPSAGGGSLLPGTTVTYRLRYAEIPMALKVVLPEIGYSTWFIEAGIDPMIRTGAFINATDNNISKMPFEQGVSPVNLAWHGGLGFDYSLGRVLSLRFQLVYKNTFLDVTRENGIRTSDNARINQVGLNLAFVF